MIYIQIGLSDKNWVHYNTFKEVQQLENYNDIAVLYCVNNELTSLPDILPKSLVKLICSNNNLTSLPDILPKSLVKLICSNNNLTSLPDTLPSSLMELDCSYNQLTSLPDTLPNSLLILRCYNNKLTSLPDTLPSSLAVLYCNNNELTLLSDTLPSHLQILCCEHNNLTSLPNSIIRCIMLHSIDYDNNEIEYIPPHLTRFLNRVNNIGYGISIYNDGQNVHNHQIQESIRNSIYNVLADKPSISIDEMTTEIISSTILTEPTKRLIMEYCEDDSIHSVLNIRFKELLVNVWSIIRSHKEKDNIFAILNDEINDANCKCFTGRMSRLINCLNGFDDRVNITIADNSQIGNIVVLVKQKLESENKYSLEKHKEIVRAELEERGYPTETIDEWLQYIE